MNANRTALIGNFIAKFLKPLIFAWVHIVKILVCVTRIAFYASYHFLKFNSKERIFSGHFCGNLIFFKTFHLKIETFWCYKSNYEWKNTTNEKEKVSKLKNTKNSVPRKPQEYCGVRIIANENLEPYPLMNSRIMWLLTSLEVNF